MTKKLFLAAASAFAAVPGVAVMITGIGTPPGSKVLFGGVVEAFGTLGLLVVWLNREKLARISLGRVTRWIIFLAIASFVCLLVYMVLYGHCVVSSPSRGTVYFPLWTSGRLAEMVTVSGSRPAALETYGSAAVDAAIALMPGTALPITTVVLLMFYQGIFTPLTVAFGFAAYRKPG